MKNRSRIAGLLLAGAICTVVSVAFGQPAQAAGPIVTLVNYGSGLCATPVGDYNGAPVVQKACTGAPEQNWATVSLGNGYSLLVNQRYFNKCMDVRDGNSANGTTIQQWDCTNTAGMNWRFIQVFDRYNKVQSKISNKCLDVAAGSLADGAKIQLYTCTSGSGNAAQIWEVR